MPSFSDVLLLHQSVYDEQIAPAFAEVDGGRPLDGLSHRYLIACTSRSGSSVLSVALERYGLSFQEYLNVRGFMERVIREQGMRSTRQFARHLIDNHAPNRTLAIKAAYAAVPFLYLLGEFPDHVDDWRIVFLTRRNTIRQAISRRIAALTGQWTQLIPARREVTDGDYDFAALVQALSSIHTENARWERLFALLGIEPCRIVYEDFTKDEAGVAERIALFLGVDLAAYPEARRHEVWIQPQTTDLNLRWEERFRAEARNWSRIPLPPLHFCDSNH